MERRLAAILAADVVGYSRLMGEDEEGTLAAVNALRTDLLEPLVAEHAGRIVKLMGDGVLAEFASAVNAVSCALAIQNDVANTNGPLTLRIGINLGDVIVENDDLFGDGVNVAARLEALADPGGICVSDMVYRAVVGRIDAAFEDMGTQQLKNIDVQVQSFNVRPAGSAGKDTREPLTPAHLTKSRKPAMVVIALVALVCLAAGIAWLGFKRGYDTGGDTNTAQTDAQLQETSVASIAVLPFENLSGDAAQGYFADGISKDITTGLSKVSGLRVTALSAAARFRDGSTSPRDIGSALAVRHLLEGSVRKQDGRVRVTAALIDAQSGAQLWAERYDRQDKDIFGIQDEITAHVVDELSQRLGGTALTSPARAYTPDIEAYDLYIRGRAKRIPPTPQNLAAALKLFEEAIARDPKFAGGYAGAAYAHVLRYSDTALDNEAASGDLKAAVLLAEKATTLDPGFGPGWASLSEAYVRERRFDDALAAAERAVKESPSDSLMRATLGRVLGHVGRPRDGIEHIRTAMRMSPDSLPLLFFLGANLRAAGDFEAAIESLKEHRERLGGRILPMPSAQLIAALSQAGRHDEAREQATLLLSKHPGFTARLVARTHVYKDTAEQSRLHDALLKAGIPE